MLKKGEEIVARPSKYQTHVAPRLKEIKSWARDGATDEELAKKLRIAVSTLYEYKKEYSEFAECLKEKGAYDNEVVDSVFKNTLGGIVKLQKPIKCKQRYYENGRLVREEEVIKMAEEEIYIHPDTMAQMYWLNNRQPSKWKAKPVDTSGEQNAKDALNEIVNAIKGASEQ